VLPPEIAARLGLVPGASVIVDEELNSIRLRRPVEQVTGMRPTGEREEMTGVNLDRVVDGLIVEHGGAANTMEPLLAIGALRVADPVED
jgi:hypothetical protein